MSFLPVADRELRLLARRRRTYYSRNLTVLVVILASMGMLYAGFGGWLSAASAGRNLFLTLSSLAAVYVLLDGALMTADCLSQEKREETLGHLFLTDLKGYDIVAGKLVSRAANSAYCLLAALPALGIALFLGGVTGRDYTCMMVALLNGLFFAASFGMLVSALCRQERRALNLAVLGVLTFAVLLPAAGWGVRFYLQAPAIHPLFLIGSPAGAFLQSLASGGSAGNPGSSFAASLAVTHLLGWCFLGAASLIVPHQCRSETAADSSQGRSPAGGQHDGKRASLGSYFKRRPSMEQNPVIWFGDRVGRRGLGLWPVFACFPVVWVVAWSLVGKSGLALPVYLGFAVVLHLSLMYGVALQACRGPVEDQRTGVLEILLTTPLGDDVYLRGRMLSLKRQCVWPLLFVVAADFGLLVAGCWQAGAWTWEWFAWIAVLAALVSKLIADLYTLSWVGFWQGLKTRNTGRAIRKTVFYVFLWRWIVLLGFIALLGLVTRGRVFNSPAGGVVAAVGYIALLVLSVLHFCGAAISELRDNLRSLAVNYELNGD